MAQRLATKRLAHTEGDRVITSRNTRKRERDCFHTESMSQEHNTLAMKDTYSHDFSC